MNRREQVGSSRDKEVGGNRQHEIFGVGHNGGPCGAGSGRGKEGNLSWRRGLPTHDEWTGR